MKKTDRREFVTWLGAATLGSMLPGCASPGAGPVKGSPADRPNVVLFYTDDMGYADLGCFGCEDIATPHIDALAAGGMRLTDFYTSAPICGPSRSSLLTGKSPQCARMPSNIRCAPTNIKGLPGSETTIAELLKKRGYASGVFGKWHLGSARECLPGAQGFERFFGHVQGCVGFFDHIYSWNRSLGPFHDLYRDEEEVHEDGRYMTELITRETNTFIRERQGKPFFAYVSYNAPHYPLEAPQEWIDRYAHIKDKNRRLYAAMLGCLDDSVGKIVAQVKALGQLDNTIFIFTNDNGPSNEGRTKPFGRQRPGRSAPFRGYKFDVYEGGIRSPFIISWPGRIKAGTVSHEPAILWDLFPTIAAAAGVKEVGKVEGRNLLPLFAGGKSPHKHLLWEFHAWGSVGGRAVRQGKWKLVVPQLRKKKGQKVTLKPELYNLATDPGETRDLAKEYPEKLQELLSIHAQWRSTWPQRSRR